MMVVIQCCVGKFNRDANVFMDLVFSSSPVHIRTLYKQSLFTSRSVRTAGPKIALRFPRVCLFACLCIHTYHMRKMLRHTLLCNCSIAAELLKVCKPSYSK